MNANLQASSPRAVSWTAVWSNARPARRRPPGTTDTEPGRPAMSKTSSWSAPGLRVLAGYVGRRTGALASGRSRRASLPCARASSPGSLSTRRGESTSPSVGCDGVKLYGATSTPNRFASTAESALTFISPKPGSAEIRLLGGRPRRTPRARAATRRRRTRPRRAPQRSWTRPAIEPGKRCTAGVSRKAASTSAGSRRASSSVPSRCLILSGPAKAAAPAPAGRARTPISSASGSRGDQLVGFVVAGEVEAVRSGDGHAERLLLECRHDGIEVRRGYVAPQRDVCQEIDDLRAPVTHHAELELSAEARDEEHLAVGEAYAEALQSLHTTRVELMLRASGLR